MATNATIVNAWKDEANAYLAVRVEKDHKDESAVEYIASTPLLDAQGQAKNNQQLKAELVAACKAQRDAQKKPSPGSLGLSGAVSL